MGIIEALLRRLHDRWHRRDEPVDLAKMLDELNAHADQSLDWRHSVVDLMKLIGIDSSEDTRRELAEELGYDGDMDSPSLNMWLHREIMRRVAANGGKVPDELL